MVYACYDSFPRPDNTLTLQTCLDLPEAWGDSDVTGEANIEGHGESGRGFWVFLNILWHMCEHFIFISIFYSINIISCFLCVAWE